MQIKVAYLKTEDASAAFMALSSIPRLVLYPFITPLFTLAFAEQVALDIAIYTTPHLDGDMVIDHDEFEEEQREEDERHGISLLLF